MVQRKLKLIATDRLNKQVFRDDYVGFVVLCWHENAALILGVRLANVIQGTGHILDHRGEALPSTPEAFALDPVLRAALVEALAAGNDALLQLAVLFEASTRQLAVVGAPHFPLVDAS